MPQVQPDARVPLMRSIFGFVDFFSGGVDVERRSLPQRVQRLLSAQEDDSERLIGWVQLFCVLVFGLLYAIASRPADAPGRVLFDPVPIALSEYTLFTVARLFLAYRMRLPGLMLLASILADVVLLLVLIWSFHGQYGQAAPFSLKVPTFIYLFVFITIRALRFDHRYVLACGLTAAAGWTVLAIAVVVQAGTGSITRSFVTHLNSNAVLVGAEIEKILILLLVTGVLAMAVRRGRALFVAAVRGQAAVHDLRRFFGRGVSDTVLTAEIEATAGMTEERDAAILMLDIRGFTHYSASLPARGVVDLLTSLHARVIPIIRSHGGIIDKFMGDGVMATFGAVQPSDSAAADALRALDAVMIEARSWQEQVASEQDAIGLVVNGAAVAGPVVFAVVGAHDRLEYTVIGPSVNLAAKLEKQNKREGTRALTTTDTYRRALLQGYWPPPEVTELGLRAVLGTSTLIDLVAVAR